MVYGVWCVVWWKLCRAQTEVELELELSDATRLRIDIIQERQQRFLLSPFPLLDQLTFSIRLETS